MEVMEELFGKLASRNVSTFKEVHTAIPFMSLSSHETCSQVRLHTSQEHHLVTPP